MYSFCGLIEANSCIFKEACSMTYDKTVVVERLSGHGQGDTETQEQVVKDVDPNQAHPGTNDACTDKGDEPTKLQRRIRRDH